MQSNEYQIEVPHPVAGYVMVIILSVLAGYMIGVLHAAYIMKILP